MRNYYFSIIKTKISIERWFNLVLSDKVKIKPKKERDCMFSIRIDKTTLDGYDMLSSITGYSRNELINQAMEYYLKVVEIDTSDESKAEQIEEFKKAFNPREL